MSGEYKLECWGAKGGTYYAEYTTMTAGLGGYAVGEKDLLVSNIIYVCVGQQGITNTGPYNYNNFAPYNNNPGNISFDIGTSGGGATSVTLSNRGELKNFASYKSEVLIVAGGGGSCEWEGHGGAGGGESGKDGVRINQRSRVGTGGTQTAGGTTGYISGDTPTNGTFGVGGYGRAYNTNFNHIDYGAQGGGGWYGGGGASYAGAAGGGSSYVGGVSNGRTIAGDASMPSPTGGTQTGQSGNGACVITQMSF